MNTDNMRLAHRSILLGILTRYGYETPWASAWLIADAPAMIARYAAIDAFFRWNEQLPDDLPLDEADARYERELALRGLDEDMIDDFWSDWQVHLQDGQIHDIALATFEADGYLTWRW